MISYFKVCTNTFSVVALLIIDGLLKPHAPGSLREPASTFLLPQDWFFLPLSFGLLMCKSNIVFKVWLASNAFLQRPGVDIAYFQISIEVNFRIYVLRCKTK